MALDVRDVGHGRGRAWAVHLGLLAALAVLPVLWPALGPAPAVAAEQADATAEEAGVVRLPGLVVTLPFAERERRPLRRAVLALKLHVSEAWAGPPELTPTSGQAAKLLDRLNLLLHAEGFGQASEPCEEPELRATIETAARQVYGEVVEEVEIERLELR